jgi:serine/threonine protein kinase
VAVKTLKPPEGVTVANPEELLKEAETMKNLEHDAIIKMLGVCIDGDPVMLILEFAPLGPLHKYLRWSRGSGL